jgi:hypothetical protein
LAGEQAKTDVFKTEVLSPGPRLRVFALIPEGEAHVQFIFAAAIFFDMGGPQSLKHKVIGFSGDWSKDQTPTRYTLQPKNTWNWKKVRGCFEEATFLTHFAKEENRGHLWNPDPGAVRAEKVLPRMVLLPTAVLHELGKQLLDECTPWEIYKAVVRCLMRPSFPVSASSCQFLKEWAMGAAQAVPGKSYSELSLKLGPIATTNRAFLEWAKSQVNAVLGPEVVHHTRAVPPAQAASALSPEIAQALDAMKEMAKLSTLLAKQSTHTATSGRATASDILKEDKSKLLPCCVGTAGSQTGGYP